MTKTLITALMFCVLLISCAEKSKDDRGYIVKVGDVAPDFTAKLDNGETFKLSDHKGKVVMLQFTASWCGVCRKEMPFIEKEIWQEHKDNGLVVIGVDRDEPAEKLEELSSATGISYPLALDPGADIFGLYANKKAGVTRNVIVNKEGNIAYMTRLFQREEFNDMKEVIEDLLKK